MKKILFILTTFTVLTAKSQTSVYHSFPDSSASWNFHYNLYCIGTGSAEEQYSIEISGDTLINGQTYHQLITPFVQSVISGVCGGNSTGYKGAFRNDTTNKKVMYVPPTESSEQLLYDFNLQVGDTVKGFLETLAFQPDIVVSTDSVWVENNYRKRWNINTCYNISFIEGIGSTFGLIQPSPGCITDYADYLLTCFTQNGRALYPDTTTVCELITGVQDISPKLVQPTISPNPFHSFALLQLNSKFEDAELKIYNSLGMLIREEKIPNQKTYVLKRNELPNGIYFLQLKNAKGETSIEKMIVE